MSSFSEKLVSVIVPAYNAEKYLRETIDSILAQTVKPYEVIVIDDGSTDSTSDIAIAYGGLVRCVRQTHGGPSKARNAGVDIAKGSYIAFLDADDLWLPEKIAIQLDIIERSEEPIAVFCQMEQFVSPEINSLVLDDSSLLSNGLSSCTMLIRRNDFLAVGKFSEQTITGEFIEWFSRAKLQGLKIHLVAKPLARRRIHEGNQDKILADETKSRYIELAKTLIDRKRSADSPQAIPKQ